MARSVKDLLAEANGQIETIPAAEAVKLAGDPGIQLVDIRETVELQKSGTAKGAIHVPRGFLEFQADPASPMHNKALAGGKKLLLFCASGGRSALAAKTLQDMGYEKVAHIGGGFTAWRDAGGPVET